MAIVISLSNTHDKSRISLLIRGQLTDLHLMNIHYFQYINGHQKAEYLWGFFLGGGGIKTYFISTFNIMELDSRYKPSPECVHVFEDMEMQTML